MTSTLLSAIVVAGLGVGSSDEFQPPTRVMADGVPVRVEEPGWACPCWADIDGDGKKDLLVGQFHGGKIRIYKNLGDGKLAAGEWLKADGAVAEIPGVW
jgi:FG-GAP-like repeat